MKVDGGVGECVAYTRGLIMVYKVLADIVVLIHFLWILFMVCGFFATVYSSVAVYLFHFSSGWAERFFDRWLFRSVHLGGIVYVAVLMILGKFCPLTIVENELRGRYDADLTYPGSFMVHYVEAIVYPEANFLIFVVPTIFIAVFTVFMFFIRPPVKIKGVFKDSGHL
jgi:H+/Cl- antiporter ClcA